MATNDGRRAATKDRPAQVKLPPPAGRPAGKGLESITRGGGEPALKRVVVPDLTKSK